MDNFREEVVVKRHRGMDSLLYGLTWIGIVIFGLIALMYFFQLEQLPADWYYDLIFIVICGGIAFLLWRNKDKLRTEYEYSFTNGDLDIAKVLGNKKRRNLTNLKLRDIESCGPVTHQSFQRYISMKDVKQHRWFLNRDAQLLYFYFTKNNVKHVVVIEPTEEMTGLIKQYSPRGVFQA